MGHTRLNQLVVYVDPPLASKAKALASRRGITISQLLRDLIVSSIEPIAPPGNDITASLTRLHIAVDALVKHHPNDKLFGIVRATQQAKCGSRSDEA